MRAAIILFLVILFLALFALVFLVPVKAAEISDAQAIRAIIGEAANEGYKGMLYIAVGIRNRGHLKGVYGVKSKHVDREPAWVWDLARRAWQESKDNRLHNATHWENIEAFGKPYWSSGMVAVCKVGSHTFYKAR